MLQTKHIELSEAELERYSAHFLLPGWTIETQLKLKNTQLVIVGAGGLGVPLATMLVTAGIGNITLIDFDMVSTSNLARQFVYTPADLGKNKAILLATQLQKQNSDIVINPVDVRISRENIESVLGDYSIICDCSDNFETRFLLNDYCLENDKLLLYGAVSQWQGVAALFNPSNGSGCLRCLMDEEGLKTVSQNCQQMGVLVTTTTMVASLMANCLFQFLTQETFSATDYSDINWVNLQDNQIKTMRLSPLESCACQINKQTLRSVTSVEEALCV